MMHIPCLEKMAGEPGPKGWMNGNKYESESEEILHYMTPADTLAVCKHTDTHAHTHAHVHVNK